MPNLDAGLATCQGHQAMSWTSSRATHMKTVIPPAFECIEVAQKQARWEHVERQQPCTKKDLEYRK